MTSLKTLLLQGKKGQYTNECNNPITTILWHYDLNFCANIYCALFVVEQMKYCQGPKCHEYKTKDRIRGMKGDKHYETRKRIYYHDEFCDQRCLYDWMRMHGQRAVDHFGRIHEPKRTGCDSAWYKSSDWNRNSGSYDQYYFINDLLGQRIRITQQQYNDTNLTTPS